MPRWGRSAADGLALTACALVLAMVGLQALWRPSVSFAASPVVDVFPIPGARVAAPQTQLTFRNVSPSSIGPLTVTGSLSGVHTGRVLADSDGKGASFIPDVAFAAGEKVTVSTGLNIARGTGGSWSFQIANPSRPLAVLPWPPVPRHRGDVQFFHSRKDLAPVSITVTTRGAAGDGDVFLAPEGGPAQVGPTILDPAGHLVWFDPMHGSTSATDFRVQRYHGQPVLTWWQGTVLAGVGASGRDEIFDNTYREVATVKAANGLNTDAHAFVITPRNTALITADYPVFWDATSVKGAAKQVVVDSVIQEIDIPTGLVLFQWDALDHLALADTRIPAPHDPRTPFDPHHLNSVALDFDGNLIISSRETWGIYKVNHQTGAVMWTLGGRHSDVKLAPGTYWAFQHDVEPHSSNDSVFTLFDNEGPPRIRTQSRGIRIKVDWKHRTVRSITDEKHNPPFASNYQGNLQQLADGDFVGWGQQPYFTQFDKHGAIVFDGHMNSATASYRVYRFHWKATPQTTPAIVASTSQGHSYVFMSWNGATSVAGWRIYAGSSPTTLKYVMSVSKKNFESKAVIPAASYVQVQALDSHHTVLRSSAVIRAS